MSGSGGGKIFPCLDSSSEGSYAIGDASLFKIPREVLVLLSPQQVTLLLEDLDYIIPRTRCNTLPLTKGHILRETERDADVLLDLVEGMPEAEARFLSVPLEKLRPLMARRQQGSSGGSSEQEADWPSMFGE